MNNRKKDWFILFTAAAVFGLIFIFMPRSSREINYSTIVGQFNDIGCNAVFCKNDFEEKTLTVKSYGIPLEWTPEYQIEGVYDEGLELYSNNQPVILFNFLCGLIVGSSVAVLILLTRKKK